MTYDGSVLFARSWGACCDSGRMADAADQERWLEALRDRAARLSFPDWERHPDDWTHLHTRYNDAGAPVTEVAVYRGVDRIHHRVYVGPDAMEFWTRLIDEIAE